ncbi:MAG: 4a-hydroxytetrahydrobiopterin dehydratase [Gammaproteobacteria bacterium]|nr:4a-hydroxytetrahydrobiopterin dehydratase [Gammaproteobacteria bacterium]
MTQLSEKKCQAYKKGEPCLSVAAIEKLCTDINADWHLDNGQKIITRKFKFPNYHQTMAFTNAVAWIAHSEDHHPDMEVSYSACVIHFSTHSVAGLSENDFICAAKIDILISE